MPFCARSRSAAFAQRIVVACVAAIAVSGCVRKHCAEKPPAPPPRVLIVAPVLNLSGNHDFDSLKVTDLIASEFQGFPGVAVVPVNRVLAELATEGKTAVETSGDAVRLARMFGADATIVVAVTEYNPYHPPVVGLTMQWYAAGMSTGTEDAAGSRASASDALSAAAPRWQVQRVFNAADEAVLDEVEHYADDRDGHRSPYGWRKYVQVQELYVRYCGWALIRTMLALDRDGPKTVVPHEAQS